MVFYLFKPRAASISNHLLLLAVGTLLPLVLFAAALAVVQARQARETFERSMHDRVVAITSAVDAELRATVAALRALAESQVLADGELERFSGMALRVKNSYPDWLTVTLADTSGLQQINARQPAGSALLRVDETASFEAVLRTRQPAIGSLSMGPRGLRHAFAVRVPVLRDGQVAHVLTAVVAPVAISRILREQGLPEDWVASVVDHRLVQVARLHGGQVQVGVSVAPAFRDALTSGGTQGAYRGSTLEGTPSFVTWRRSAYSDWSVGIGVPAKSVDAGAWRLLGIGLLGLVVALALALWFARRLARHISEPMALLAAQARALRRGHDGPSRQPLQPEAPGRPGADESPGATEAVQPLPEGPSSTDMRMWELRDLQSAFDDAAQAMRALGQARAQAEDANRAKDEFLAMLGHELRNPLSAIAGAVHLLNARPERPAAAALAQGVLARQTAHMTKLVDDLLDASRVSQGKIELDRRPLDFAALVQRVAVQVVGSSPQHPLDLRLEPAWVSGDDTRLEQIVSNLLGNAVRYSPGGGRIQVALVRRADRVVLTVRDQGVGMGAELLPRVFDLFVQGARGAARSQGGLGIGLTLAYRLAELHGGTLGAYSNGEGQGSTFTLTLPGIEPLSGVEPAPVPAPSERAAGRTLEVLLVEDNEDGRTVLRQLLEGAGHRVTEAVDGQQALELASAAVYDVALIDIGLPRIDGLQVAARLRQRGALLATMPLVAISGYGAPQDHARSRAAGFDLHLVKPVDGADLLDQLQRLLRARAGEAGSDAFSGR